MGSEFTQTVVGDQIAPTAVAAKGSLASKLKDAQASIASTVKVAAPASSPTRSAPPIIQPTLLSPAHVLFKAMRKNLGAQFKIKLLKFVDGYYQTADAEEIKYLRENAAHFDLTEVSE